MRAPIPRYHLGWNAGVAFAEAELATIDRPGHWAHLELARRRAERPKHLRDDFAWGYRDGVMVTLAHFLYGVEDAA